MSRLLILLFSHSLSMAPVEAEPAPELEPELEPMEESSASTQPLEYADAVAELQAANTAVTEDPDVGTDRLAKAIEGFAEFGPELAADRTTQRLRFEAMLNLARLQSSSAPDMAPVTMDQAIREAHGDSLPVARFGPRMEALYADRLDAMNDLGTAMIEVKCSIRCRIYIDGREKPIVSGPLHLGTHQVWIEDAGGKYPALRSVEVLSVADETRVISFGPRRTSTPGPVVAPKLGRAAPKWVEVTLITLGTAMLVGGGVAASLNCDANDPCPYLFDGRAMGTALLGVGGISVGVGAALAGVDRGRSNRSELSLAVGWRMQF